MIEVFSEGIEQSITQVLKNRDARVMEQQLLFKKLENNQSLINAKLNIPGPIKNNYYLSQVFKRGLKQFLTGYKVSYQLIWDIATGPEAFVVINEATSSVKENAIKFEDNNEFGRLFDIDVLIYSNELHPLSRKDFDQQPRKCLICEKPAKVCARSRTHSVIEMQGYINKLINNNLEFLWN
ncbi:citrate lyase holo-[acyl-carrier protein] synthase [Companilactobacillus kimchiensis]|uniref:citrate lyase holo-[acyl-carrier protein] synthase n=1 Tax=Companilactobacillus kimchiensis TaxID=993692 RepID=A0A0R2LBS5_9LACO|nr:citrate lyase holo-[acyl-carrier protein] synthase [Companilactobacillus kimchiensis]KRN99099.1 hypothetical protein IV57_GL000524 [Companilactobacillus kimchiensis]